MAERNFKKIIAASVIGSILLGAGTSVSALAKTPGAESSAYETAQNYIMPGCKAVSPDEMVKDLKARLDPLVKARTITKSQEDKILSQMKARYSERISEMEKVKNMTEAERKAYFASRPKDRPHMLKELVDSNVISKAQADEVRKAIGHKDGKGFDKRINEIKNSLDTAVKDGTITQAQEDKILAFMKQKHEIRKAEMEKVKSMTEAERKAYFESKNRTAKTDLFTDLINAGTITNAQAEKLKTMMPPCPGSHGRNDRPSMNENEKQPDD